MKKDMTYYDLFDRLIDHQCPICRMIEDRTNLKMDFMLYESINDRSLREQFIEDDGFCAHHSTIMRKKGDPLAHAIIYGHLLKSKLRELHASNYTHNATGCQFCDAEKTNEKNYVFAFCQYLDEQDFKSRYQSSGRLCHAHLVECLKTSRTKKTLPANLAWLKRVTIEKYEQLLYDLEEIQRKSDYRFRDESWTDSEKEAWKKVVAMLIDEGGHRR